MSLVIPARICISLFYNSRLRHASKTKAQSKHSSVGTILIGQTVTIHLLVFTLENIVRFAKHRKSRGLLCVFGVQIELCHIYCFCLLIFLQQQWGSRKKNWISIEITKGHQKYYGFVSMEFRFFFCQNSARRLLLLYLSYRQ